jgi:hypothetical protein
VLLRSASAFAAPLSRVAVGTTDSPDVTGARARLVLIRLVDIVLMITAVKELTNRLHHHVSSMVSIRHNDGFDSLSNNLGRIPNLARTVASKSIIFCFIFYCSLVDEFSTYGGLAFSTI